MRVLKSKPMREITLRFYVDSIQPGVAEPYLVRNLLPDDDRYEIPRKEDILTFNWTQPVSRSDCFLVKDVFRNYANGRISSADVLMVASYVRD